MLCWQVSYGQPKPRPTRSRSRLLISPTSWLRGWTRKAGKVGANKAGMEALLLALGQQEEAIREGGGPKAIEAQHDKKR